MFISSSDFGSDGKFGTLKPWSCNSLIAPWSCGMDALMLGSLMMFASAWFASSPSSASASGTRWSLDKCSGKWARIRAAREMSLSSYFMSALVVNACKIGRRE